MQDPPPIATHFRLDTSRPAIQFGGRRAYAALDRRDATKRILALNVEPLCPPRPRFLARAVAPVPNALLPVDHGPGQEPDGAPAWFILCQAPPGPALAANAAPWAESDIVANLLLPAAQALESLEDQGLTHRAIRPDNLFRSGGGERAVLGPCWAAPPAYDQPAAFEPPYSAMCLPAGRGEGSIADDVYALGATMLWCALGGQVAWPDSPAMLVRKLEAGSLEALLGGRTISPTLLDLIRSMLAEDPEHRPSPSLLQDPTQARSRRVATRPPPRAPKPIDVGGVPAASARELALAIARAPEAGEALIRSGAVDRWLRRTLGDTHAAVGLDEAVFRRGSDPEPEDNRSHPTFIMRAVAALDPLAPMVWRGQMLFPDGVPGAAAAAIAAESSALGAAVEEIVQHEITMVWASGVPRRRADLPVMAQQAKDWRRLLITRGAAGSLRRLAYTANPTLACASPLLPPGAVLRLPALLAALEAASAGDRGRAPIDPHMIAFMAAHADSTLLPQIAGIDGFATARDRLGALALFARLQHTENAGKLPGLAGWLLASGLGRLDDWHNKRTRTALADGLQKAATAGDLAAMAGLLRNDAAREADQAGSERAARRLAAITAELATLRGSRPARARTAQRAGQDAAAATGLLAIVGAASLLAIP